MPKWRPSGRVITFTDLRDEMMELMREREEDMLHRHQANIDNLRRQHLEEVRQMIVEFDSAQKYLKQQMGNLSKQYFVFSE